MFFIKQPSFEKRYRLCYDKGEEGKNAKRQSEKAWNWQNFLTDWLQPYWLRQKEFLKLVKTSQNRLKQQKTS